MGLAWRPRAGAGAALRLARLPRHGDPDGAAGGEHGDRRAQSIDQAERWRGLRTVSAPAPKRLRNVGGLDTMRKTATSRGVKRERGPIRLASGLVKLGKAQGGQAGGGANHDTCGPCENAR
jgi:hypothetical protein